MAKLTYILCGLASLTCAILLIRSYLRGRTPLLLWSSLCFVGLTVNHVMLWCDVVAFPDIDFSLWRSGSALLALALLLFGLIWE
jgi:hypothetical protein